jgi:serine protease
MKGHSKLTKLVFLLPLSAHAATYNVPGDFASIQAAIDAAVDGDEIVVAPGEYVGQQTVMGKAITLRSSLGPAVTRLSGTGDHTDAALVVRNVTSGTFEVRGFTLSGSTLQAGPPSAFLVSNSHAAIIGNVFTGNSGHVASISSSTARVERNHFHSNYCTNFSSSLHVSYGVNTQILNNVFSDNDYCGGIEFSGSTTSGPTAITNNTFVDTVTGVNFSLTPYPAEVIVRNNVFAAFSSRARAGNAVRVATQAPALTWEHNVVYGYTTPFFGFPDPSGANGNQTADPMLSGAPAMDFRPDTGSPLIDAGLNSEVTTGATDYYDQERINPATGVVDIGAVEYYLETPVVALFGSRTTALLSESVDLRWEVSSGADACTASGAWSGARPLNGMETLTLAAYGSNDFTLTCTQGAVTRAKTVSVFVLAPPSLRFDDDLDILIGQSATIDWRASGATSCEASGAWSGSKPASGEQTQTPESAGVYDYELTCTNEAGSVSGRQRVTVHPTPSVTVTISPTVITLGQSATLTWTTIGTYLCERIDHQNNPAALNGEYSFTPTTVGQLTQTIKCLTPINSEVRASATLTVNTPPPPPPPPPPAARRGGGGAFDPLVLFGLGGLLVLVAQRRSRSLACR